MVMKVYSDEFKADAVALFNSDPDLTIAQVARDLGVNAETLRNWIRKDRSQPGGDVKSTKDAVKTEVTREELQAEIAALKGELKAVRKENVTLATERDILRKATKFFAGEMTW
jgi:transposase